MKLTRKEAQFRMKLIQENHYDKKEQQIVTTAIVTQGLSYKRVYTEWKRGKIYFFMAAISVSRVNKAFIALGISTVIAAENMRMLSVSAKA